MIDTQLPCSVSVVTSNRKPSSCLKETRVRISSLGPSCSVAIDTSLITNHVD